MQEVVGFIQKAPFTSVINLIYPFNRLEGWKVEKCLTVQIQPDNF